MHAVRAGLWVHAPVAPTAECVRLVKELGAPVEYIVLPTYAYEHKTFVGPFSRAFPKAKVRCARAYMVAGPGASARMWGCVCAVRAHVQHLVHCRGPLLMLPAHFLEPRRGALATAVSVHAPIASEVKVALPVILLISMGRRGMMPRVCAALLAGH